MRSIRAITAIAVLVLGSSIGAEDSPSDQGRSQAAKTALSKRETAAQKALANYRNALAEADKQLVVDIDAALRRPAISKDAEANDELLAQKRSAQQRLKEAKSSATDVEFPIIAATYGSVDKSIDVIGGVRQRLSKNQDIWVDKNLTDGRLQSDGDLRVVFRSAVGKPIVLVCRHGSRVFFTR